MAEEQRRAVRLRRELTERFILLAFSRGRLHVSRRPDAAEHCETIARRLLPEYAKLAIVEARP